MSRMEDILNEINGAPKTVVESTYRDSLDESENLDVTDEDLRGLGSGNMATLLSESIKEDLTGTPPKRDGNKPEKPASENKQPETKTTNNVTTKPATSSDDTSTKNMTESQYIQFLEAVLESELEYDKESLTEAAMEYHNVL